MMSKMIIILMIIVVLLIAAVIIVTCLYFGAQKNVKKLEYDSTHDKITGHTNWNWLWDQIQHTSDEKALPYDFVHFDIKGFRMYNEIYNHDVGNAVLQHVSKKLYEQKFIKYSARCHNDNFAFVTDPMDHSDLHTNLNKMFEDMSIIPGLEEMPMYFRCGVVERNKLLRSQDTVADMAKMAQALGQKQNCTEIFFYDDNMKDIMLEGERLKSELPEAIMRDEILVYFQPKINPVDDSIAGAEALVRWMFHGKKLMFPGDFVPHLEKNNAINILDEQVLEKVCQYLEKWKQQGKILVPISVNLSQQEIYKNSLLNDITSIVNKYDIDRSLIEFELTESAAYEDKDYLMNVMNSLRNEGFSIAMDDFGTGYSSFGLLKDMPLTTLKIDKSFVDSVCNSSDTKGERVVNDIINMVKHLEIKCVAEGVEYVEQKEKLRNWGCDYIQGYFYSKPIPANDFEEKYLIK